MADFSWIAQVAEKDWSEAVSGKCYLKVTRAEFARRSQMVDSPDLINAFYKWASGERHSYALAWDSPITSEGLVLLSLRKMGA